jgi:hypothetical protein
MLFVCPGKQNIPRETVHERLELLIISYSHRYGTFNYSRRYTGIYNVHDLSQDCNTIGIY